MGDTAIQEQQPAPDFTLPAVGSDDIVENGQVHLADLKGQTVVLYFYPKQNNWAFLSHARVSPAHPHVQPHPKTD